MKKFLMICTAVLILVSCVSHPKNLETNAKDIIFWDESITKEQCAGVYITDGLTVTSYNGAPVNWGPDVLLYLPPGEVNFTFAADYDYGYSHFSGEDIPFKWLFGAGEGRYIRGGYRGNNAVLFVIDPNNKAKWYNQSAYEIPRQRIILQ